MDIVTIDDALDEKETKAVRAKRTRKQAKCDHNYQATFFGDFQCIECNHITEVR